jgi:DNA-binding transcriptional ArsR family regulator
MSSLDRHTTRQVPESVRAALFASDRRCRLLQALAEAGGEASASDLAAQIHTAEPDSPDCPDTIQYDLYDSHLPKLTATGIVEYDSTLDKLRLLDADAAQTAVDTLAE